MSAHRMASIALAACALLAFACGKTPATGSADAAPPPAPATAIMPPVGADYNQLLPDVPAGYTACTASPFDPRIDETTAATRSRTWQAEAASFKALLHPVDVRAASGNRDDDDQAPDDKRAEGVARFTLPRGVVEMRFPGRLSTIRTARQAAQPQYARQPAEPFGYLLAPLATASRVLVGDGWLSRGTDGISPSMEVDAFLVKESVEETTRILARHAEHAVAAITCALEEGMHQRGAYRVATSTEPDGTAFVQLGATAGSFCVPNSRWHALIGVRRVGESTVVMAFQIPSEHSEPLCKTTLRAVQLR